MNNIVASGTANEIARYGGFGGRSIIGSSSLTDNGTTFAIGSTEFTVTESNGNTAVNGTLTADAGNRVFDVAGTDLSSSTNTISCPNFTSGAGGCVTASGGGTSNYLRADGTWAAPGGGGGGTVTTSGTPTTNTLALFTGSTVIGNSVATDDGTNFEVNGTKFKIVEASGNTTIAGTLTADGGSRVFDATGTGLTSSTNTVSIATTGVSAGSYTNASITVNAEGQLTSASSGTAPVTPSSPTTGDLMAWASSTTAGNYAGSTATACAAGQADTQPSLSAAGVISVSCSTFFNTAGSNLSASGSTVSVVNNPTFSGLETTQAGIAASSGSTATNPINATNANTAQTASGESVSVSDTGSYATTSGALSDYAIHVSNTGTRSTGTNALTNYGIYTTASGAQTNVAFEADNGAVLLNNSGGNTVIGTAGSAYGTLTVESTGVSNFAGTLEQAGAQVFSAAGTNLSASGATVSCPTMTSGGGGCVPSGGTSSTFLRGDATWQTLSGGGTVTTSGTPTTGALAEFTGSTVIGNSPVIDNGTSVALGNSGTTVTESSGAMAVGGLLTASAGVTSTAAANTFGNVEYVDTQDSTSSGTVADYTLGANTTMLVLTGGNISLDGMSGGVDGRTVYVCNGGTSGTAAQLVYNSASGTSGHKFEFLQGDTPTSIRLSQGACAQVLYDGTLAAWRVFEKDYGTQLTLTGNLIASSGTTTLGTTSTGRLTVGGLNASNYGEEVSWTYTGATAGGSSIAPLYVTDTGSYSTASGALSEYDEYISVNPTRSAGSNNLTEYGLGVFATGSGSGSGVITDVAGYFTATGTGSNVVNEALIADSGNVILNNSSGTTTLDTYASLPNSQSSLPSAPSTGINVMAQSFGGRPTLTIQAPDGLPQYIGQKPRPRQPGLHLPGNRLDIVQRGRAQHRKLAGLPGRARDRDHQTLHSAETRRGAIVGRVRLGGRDPRCGDALLHVVDCEHGRLYDRPAVLRLGRVLRDRGLHVRRAHGIDFEPDSDDIAGRVRQRRRYLLWLWRHRLGAVQRGRERWQCPHQPGCELADQRDGHDRGRALESAWVHDDQLRVQSLHERHGWGRGHDQRRAHHQHPDRGHAARGVAVPLEQRDGYRGRFRPGERLPETPF